MTNLKKQEIKIEKISELLGISYWEDDTKDCTGSPPSYFDRKTLKPVFNRLSPIKLPGLLLEYFGLKIVLKEKKEENWSIEKIKK